jgi:hypothetical protein
MLKRLRALLLRLLGVQPPTQPNPPNPKSDEYLKGIWP